MALKPFNTDLAGRHASDRRRIAHEILTRMGLDGVAPRQVTPELTAMEREIENELLSGSS